MSDIPEKVQPYEQWKADQERGLLTFALTVDGWRQIRDPLSVPDAVAQGYEVRRGVLVPDGHVALVLPLERAQQLEASSLDWDPRRPRSAELQRAHRALGRAILEATPAGQDRNIDSNDTAGLFDGGGERDA